MRRYNLGIAGFGIAGGALAVMLARSGHQVTLFERAPQVQPVGAGLLLQPSGQRVLSQLNLLDEIIPHSEPIHELRAFRENGRALVHLHYDQVMPGACAYGVHRGLLFETLLNAARAAQITLLPGCEITRWKIVGDQVIALASDGQECGSFDFLIAADGGRSHLRQTLNPELKLREYEFGAMWAVGRGTQVRGRLQQMTRGARNLLGLLPVGNGNCTLFWGLRHDQLEAVRQRGFDAWRRELIALCPQAEETLDDIGTFERVIFSGYQHVRPRKIFNSHIALIGDAAHSMSPHLGQGANLALVDAECLAQHLNAESHPEAAFAGYAAARLSQVRYYAQLSRWLSPFFQSESFLLGFGRDLALPLMCAIPPIRRVMELSVAGGSAGWMASIRALLEKTSLSAFHKR